MAQAKEKNAPEATNTAPLSDALIVVAVDDGVTGHFITLNPPVYDNSAGMQSVFAIGFKYEATRHFQSVAKKTVKAKGDVTAALATAASTWKPEPSPERVETIGTMRAEIGREMLKARLTELKGTAPNEATLTAHLPTYLGKYADKVDAALRAKLAGGYTPTRKGTGTDSASAPVTAISADDL